MRPSHIVIIIVVLIILFGASKLPDIARSIGQSAKVLKKEMRELSDDDGSTPVAQPQSQLPCRSTAHLRRLPCHSTRSNLSNRKPASSQTTARLRAQRPPRTSSELRA